MYSKLMFVMLQVVGLLPVSLSHFSSRTEFSIYCTPHIIYTVLLAIFFCLICFLRIWILVIDMANPSFFWSTLNSRAEIFVTFGNFISTFLCCTVSFYLAIFRLDKKVALLKSLYETELLLKGKNVFNKPRVLSFLNIFHVSVLIVINVVSTSSPFVEAATQLTKLINTFSLIEFMEIVLIIKEQFQVLNKLTRDIMFENQSKHMVWSVALPPVETSTISHCKTLNVYKLSKTHWTLCQLAVNSAELYGPLLVLFTINFFTHLIFIPYYLFLLQSRGGGMLMTVLSISWLFIYIIQLYMLVWPCSLVMDQAHKTLAVVSQLMSSCHNTQLLQQLSIFAQQLVHRQVHFSACGLFNLHTRVAVSVISAVITYLAIIIQFRESRSISTLN